MKRTIVLGLAVALAVTLGCRKSVTYTAPDGTQATVTKSGDQVTYTVTGKDGQKVVVSGSDGMLNITGEKGEKVQIATATAGKEVPLPEGFPSDAPTYPGAKVVQSMKFPNGMTVMFQTADPTDKVSAFYKEKLKANGWEVKSTIDMPQGTMLVGSKGGQVLNAAVSHGDEGTTIALSLGKE